MNKAQRLHERAQSEHFFLQLVSVIDFSAKTTEKPVKIMRWYKFNIVVKRKPWEEFAL